MRRALLVSFAALAVAACNNQKGGDNETQAAAEVKMKAGEWQTTAEIQAIDMPGAPPAVTDAMLKQLKQKPLTSTSCLTEEDVNKANAKLLTGKENPNCSFDKNEMKGGRVDVKMRCTTPQGNVQMVMNGTYTPETMALDSEVEMAGADGKQMVHQKARVTGKRIGECKAGAAAGTSAPAK